MPNETAWLIENSRGALCLGLCDGELAWMDFSDERALRFARQSDGLRVRALLQRIVPFHVAGSPLKDANVNEHVWCDKPAASAPEQWLPSASDQEMESR